MRSGWLRAAAGAAAATSGGLASSSIWARAAADDSGQAAGSGGGNGGGAWLDPRSITFLKAWTGGSLDSEHFPSAPAADNTLSGLLPKREHTHYVPAGHVDVGVCGAQGMRGYMEDRWSVATWGDAGDAAAAAATAAGKTGGRESARAGDDGTPWCSLLAVFDGHGGQVASEFSSRMLPVLMDKYVEQTDRDREGQGRAGRGGTGRDRGGQGETERDREI
jgi:hypothetical protein